MDPQHVLEIEGTREKEPLSDAGSRLLSSPSTALSKKPEEQKRKPSEAVARILLRIKALESYRLGLGEGVPSGSQHCSDDQEGPSYNTQSGPIKKMRFGMLCFRCGKRGHVVRECESLLQKCFNCSEMTNHIAAECPYPKFEKAKIKTEPAIGSEMITGGSIIKPAIGSDQFKQKTETTRYYRTCYRCGDPGHELKDCKSILQICYNCHELTSHIAADCPHPKSEPAQFEMEHTTNSGTLMGSSSMVGPAIDSDQFTQKTKTNSCELMCFQCGEQGHRESECKSVLRKSNQLASHIAADCPVPKPEPVQIEMEPTIDTRMIPGNSCTVRPVTNSDQFKQKNKTTPCTIVCHRCGEEGHGVHECELVLRKCYNCKEVTSHIAADCPYPKCEPVHIEKEKIPVSGMTGGSSRFRPATDYGHVKITTKKTSYNIVCHRCGKKGHGANDCKSALHKCYNCNKLVNHIAADCPFPKSQLLRTEKERVVGSRMMTGGPSRTRPATHSNHLQPRTKKTRCYRCGEKGHEAPECESALQICFNCKELTSHIAADCPFPKRKPVKTEMKQAIRSGMISEGSSTIKPATSSDKVKLKTKTTRSEVVCSRCGKKGHGANQCVSFLQKCYNCDMLVSHIAADCPFPKSEPAQIETEETIDSRMMVKGSSTVRPATNSVKLKLKKKSAQHKVVCYRCGKKGHPALECKSALRKCYNCRKLVNHIAADCPFPKSNPAQIGREEIIGSGVMTGGSSRILPATDSHQPKMTTMTMKDARRFREHLRSFGRPSVFSIVGPDDLPNSSETLVVIGKEEEKEFLLLQSSCNR